MTPAPGAYREPLRAGLERLGVKDHPEIRLAKTEQPIVGMDVRADLTPLVCLALDSVKDRFACCAYYIESLDNGSVVPITPGARGGQEYWSPGELFFKS